MKKVLLAIAILTMLSVPACAQNEMAWLLTWVDNNNPPADSFRLYVSADAGGEYSFLTATTDTHITVNSPNDVRLYYAVTALRQMTESTWVESGLSNWVSGRIVDLTEGVYDTPRIFAYKQEGENWVSLVVWPLTAECVLDGWTIYPDVIRLRCPDAELAPDSLYIEQR